MNNLRYVIAVMLTFVSITSANRVNADEILEYRQPVNTVTVSGTPSAIEYSNTGTEWRNIPFIQLGNECFFESVSARMLRLTGDAELNGSGFYTERPVASDSALEEKLSALEDILYAAERDDLSLQVDKKMETLSKMCADSHYSRYEVLNYRQELENFMDEVKEQACSLPAQLGTARESILNSISGSFVYTEAVDRSVKDYMSTLQTPLSASDTLWPDITEMGVQSASLTSVYTRIYTMALVYRCERSSYYMNSSVLESIKTALDAADRLWYNSNTTMYGNWWDFLIGVPSRYSKILAVVWDELSTAEKERYADGLEYFCRYQAYSGSEPKPGEEQAGTNLVNIANYDYIMGVLTENKDKIERAVERFYSVFEYKEENSELDGFYSDGSFLQHGVPYNGNYGREFLNGIVDMAESLNGTCWGFSESRYERINEWIENGYLPLVFKSSMMDIVNGRAIVRNNTEKTHGYQVGRTILHYAELLRDADKKRQYCETVKYWFLNSSPSNGITWETSCDELSRKLITSSEYNAVDHTQTGIYVYPNMDRAVYRPSADWAVGIAMYSSRIPSYELTNGENTKGWYTGSGAVYLYNEDDAHYAENYWLAADMYSIPGTTVDSTVRYYDGEGSHYQDGDAEGKSTKDFAGSAVWKNTGAAAMEFEQISGGGAYSDLTARKSYFMFPEGVLCMGTGISGGNGDVYTCVENRAVEDGEYSLFADGASAAADGGLINAKTVSVSGKCGNISWYFPSGGDISLKHETRSAIPSEVRYGSTDPMITKGFLTIKLEHGTSPENASYCYMLLPDKTASETAEYASSPNVRVLNKDNALHAVYYAPNEETAAVFFEAGELVTGSGAKVSCSAPAIVIIGDNGDLALSEPTRKLDSVTITLDGGFEYQNSEYVKVSRTADGRTAVTFNMEGQNGKTLHLQSIG